jgi:AraC family transcriptional activator of pobA
MRGIWIDYHTKKPIYRMLVTSNEVTHTDHKTDSVDHKSILPFVIGKLESEVQDLQLGATTRLTQIEIIWIKRGRGNLIADFSTVAFDGNIIFCLAPGAQRRIVADTELHGYYLSLSTDFLRLSEGQTNSSILSAQHVRVSKFVALEPEKELEYEMTDVISKMIKEYTHYYMLRSEILKVS